MPATHWPRRLSHDKLRLDCEFRLVMSALLDALNHRFCRNLSHPQQRLPHGGQGRISKGRPWNVVESHHGHVFRDSQTRFTERPNRSDRGDVIVGEHRCEGPPAGQTFLAAGVADHWRLIRTLNLRSQLRSNAHSKLCCYFHNRIPTYCGIGTEGLALQERDFLVPEL